MQTVEKFEQMQEQECSVDTDPTSEQPEVEEQTLSRKWDCFCRNYRFIYVFYASGLFSYYNLLSYKLKYSFT